MDIYNLKPAWVAVIEETKKELGRELTDEEVKEIYWNTRNYATTLGTMYSRYFHLEGQDSDAAVNKVIEGMVMDGMTD